LCVPNAFALLLLLGFGVNRWQPQREFLIRPWRMWLSRRNKERDLAAVLSTRGCGIYEICHREDPSRSRWLAGP